MKRILLFNIAALFMASAAFAAASAQIKFDDAGKKVVGSGGPATDASIGKLSTKVGLGWNTGANGYAINTQHQQGTKAYGTSHDSTSIYVIDATAIGTAVDAPSASDSSAFGSDWKTM